MTRPLRAGEVASARPIGGQRAARPKVAVDIVLFAVESERLKCYLVQLKAGPAKGAGPFPAAWCASARCSTKRRGANCTFRPACVDPYIEQLFTFGDPTRDPGRTWFRWPTWR